LYVVDTNRFTHLHYTVNDPSEFYLTNTETNTHRLHFVEISRNFSQMNE